MGYNEPWVTIYDKIPESIMAVEVSAGNLDELVSIIHDCIGYNFISNRENRYVEFQFKEDSGAEPTLCKRVAIGDHLILSSESRRGHKVVEVKTSDELQKEYLSRRTVLSSIEVESVRDILHSLNHAKIAKLKELLGEL